MYVSLNRTPLDITVVLFFQPCTMRLPGDFFTFWSQCWCDFKLKNFLMHNFSIKGINASAGGTSGGLNLSAAVACHGGTNFISRISSSCFLRSCLMLVRWVSLSCSDCCVEERRCLVESNSCLVLSSVFISSSSWHGTRTRMKTNKGRVFGHWEITEVILTCQFIMCTESDVV